MLLLWDILAFGLSFYTSLHNAHTYVKVKKNIKARWAKLRKKFTAVLNAKIVWGFLKGVKDERKSRFFFQTLIFSLWGSRAINRILNINCTIFPSLANCGKVRLFSDRSGTHNLGFGFSEVQWRNGFLKGKLNKGPFTYYVMPLKGGRGVHLCNKNIT